MGWEIRIWGCEISFGNTRQEEIENNLLQEHDKLMELENSDDRWDQVGGQQNFDQLMVYKDQITQELIEYGCMDEDEDIEDEEDIEDVEESSEDPWWKFW